MTDSSSRLTRIGVFYDGGFFSQVSNYYCYQHERKARLSVTGLHEFIRERGREGRRRRQALLSDRRFPLFPGQAVSQ